MISRSSDYAWLLRLIVEALLLVLVTLIPFHCAALILAMFFRGTTSLSFPLKLLTVAGTLGFCYATARIVYRPLVGLLCVRIGPSRSATFDRKLARLLFHTNELIVMLACGILPQVVLAPFVAAGLLIVTPLFPDAFAFLCDSSAMIVVTIALIEIILPRAKQLRKSPEWKEVVKETLHIRTAQLRVALSRKQETGTSAWPRLIKWLQRRVRRLSKELNIESQFADAKPDAYTRGSNPDEALLEIIRMLGKVGVPAVLKIFRDAEDIRRKSWIFIELAATRDPRVIPALAPYLDDRRVILGDKHERVCDRAAWSIATIIGYDHVCELGYDVWERINPGQPFDVYWEREDRSIEKLKLLLKSRAIPGEGPDLETQNSGHLTRKRK